MLDRVDMIKDIDSDEFTKVVLIGKEIEYCRFMGIDTNYYLDDKNSIIIGNNCIYKLDNDSYLRLYSILKEYREKLRHDIWNT